MKITNNNLENKPANTLIGYVLGFIVGTAVYALHWGWWGWGLWGGCAEYAVQLFGCVGGFIGAPIGGIIGWQLREHKWGPVVGGIVGPLVLLHLSLICVSPISVILFFNC